MFGIVPTTNVHGSTTLDKIEGVPRSIRSLCQPPAGGQNERTHALEFSWGSERLEPLMRVAHTGRR